MNHTQKNNQSFTHQFLAKYSSGGECMALSG